MAFWETIDDQLKSKGFRPVNNKENWFWRAENPVLYLVCLMNGKEDGWREDNMTFADFSKQMERHLEEFHCTRLVALSVLVDKAVDIFPVDTVESGDSFSAGFYDEKFYRIFWQFSTETGKITSGKNQPDQLIGIEKLLLAAAKGKAPKVLVLRDTKEQKKPVATVAIFAVCAAVLAWMTFSGHRSEIIMNFGLGQEGIQNGEYYRFVTSMFLHSGIMHLASNCVYLYYFGVRSEKLLGSGRFLLLYFAAGLCGGLFSLFFEDGYGVSIGASGAMYGLLGAMLLLTKKRGPQYTGMNYATMLLLALTAVGFGFLEPGVDNMAHIGGLLGGMGMFALLLGKK